MMASGPGDLEKVRRIDRTRNEGGSDDFQRSAQTNWWDGRVARTARAKPAEPVITS
jgi:hypothetical protein